MKFHYVASDPTGRILEDNIEALSSYDVLNFLAKKGLRPISIKINRSVDVTFQRFFGQSVTIEDKIFLTKYLALMLRAGTDLFKAVTILIQDFEKPVLKALLIEIRNTLEKGQPFYVTFSKYPRYFSTVFVSLIKAGEVSGNLEDVFYNLSVSLQKDQELYGRVKSAFVYPVILISVSALILLLLVSFALPKVADVFLKSGFKVPLFSKIVFTVGLFINANKLIIFPGLFVFVLVTYYFFSKTTPGRQIVSRFINKTPIINKVTKEMALQRFASTLASLMKAGLPILDSLEITADSVGNEDLRQALLRISREGVAKGLTIGEAFRKEPFFPMTITNLIAVSEKAGHTEDILNTLAEFYTTEIDGRVKNLVAFLEPILLLGIGVIIGTIALVVIVPVYQLVGGM
ncbi:MAG: type II secretion system F family protein [Minisyncoccota bacterium]